MGPIVALDISGNRIGIARCDPTGTLVSPQGVIDRRTGSGGRKELAKALDDQRAGLLLVGLPLGRDGATTVQSDRIRAMAADLLAGRPEPIEYFDESFTTAESIHRYGQNASDAHAAVVMLEHFLLHRRDRR